MNSRFSCWTFAAVLMLSSVFAEAQGVRWDLGSPGSAGAVTVGNGAGGFSPLYALTGVQLNWCNHPANTVPCTNYATTYTSISLNVACPVNAPVVLQGSTTCQGTGDNFGNLGVWTASNTVCTATCYDYTLTVNGVSSGPFVWIAGGGGGNSGFTSAVGFQAIPPALPYVVWAEDPTGMCSYPAAILTQGQPLLCINQNDVPILNFGNGPQQMFLVRPPSGIVASGAIPQWVPQNGDFEVLPLGTLPTATAQLGDCLRFNVAGDGNWDAVNCSFEMDGIYSTVGGAPVGFGPVCTGNIGFATGTGNSGIFPTATRRAGITYFITPGASTSTVEGMTCGQNGNNSLFPVLAWYHFSALFAQGSLTNSRYWIGLGTWNVGSGTGTNSAAILNTTKFATDTPNSNLIGFRYSSTTDTTWKAVTCVAGGSCTVVDTTITADTNPHLFEITTNSLGTSLQYLIDGTFRAAITTNIPAVASSSDSLVDMFWTADNKNTVTSPNATFYSMSFSVK